MKNLRLVQSIKKVCEAQQNIFFGRKDFNLAAFKLVVSEIIQAPVVVQIALKLFLLPINFSLLVKIHWGELNNEKTFTTFFHKLIYFMIKPVLVYVLTLDALSWATDEFADE